MFKYFILAALIFPTYSYSSINVEVVCVDQTYHVFNSQNGTERVWMNGTSHIYNVELNPISTPTYPVWVGSLKLVKGNAKVSLTVKATEEAGNLHYRNELFITINGMTAENYGSSDKVEVRLRNGSIGTGWLCSKYNRGEASNSL
jgi:hypothetical protein